MMRSVFSLMEVLTRNKVRIHCPPATLALALKRIVERIRQTKKTFVAQRMVSVSRWAGKVKLIERSNLRVERRFWRGEWFVRQAPTGSLFCTGVKTASFGLIILLGRECAAIRFGCAAFRYKGCWAGWPRNLMAARMVSTTNASKAASCASLNGASLCVGARAFKAGTFAKICAIRTNTFK